MRGEWAGNCQIRSLLRCVSANEVLSQLPSCRSNLEPTIHRKRLIWNVKLICRRDFFPDRLTRTLLFPKHAVYNIPHERNGVIVTVGGGGGCARAGNTPAAASSRQRGRPAERG